MKRFVLMIAAVLLAYSAAGAADMFTLKRAGEKTIAATALPNGMHFRGFEGKPVLVNFFGKNCRYCKREIPHLAALKQRYKDRIGIIGIHVQERMSSEERSALQKQLGINYPFFEYDDNMAIVRHIGSRAGYNGSIPFNIFFNGKGDVVEIVPGYLGEQDLEMIFSELLKR
ncbi:MAG: TlpA disulfide reductase family protein [Campylobacterales bacterium]|jgi:thiol-disulfide isomerase/thioredoxin